MSIFKKYKIYLHLIGIGLFIYLLFKIDLNNAFNDIKKFNYNWLVAYVICYSFMVIMKSLRWKTLLIAQSIDYSLLKTIKISISSNFWGTFTPGRVGEFVKLDYLQKDNYPLIKSIGNIFIDRIFDLIMLLIFSLISLIYFLDLYLNELKELFIMISFAIIIGILFFLFRNGIKTLIRLFLKELLKPTHYEKIGNQWNELINELKKINLVVVVKMFVISILIYMLFFLMTYIVALGFNISVPFVYLSLCMAISSLVSLLPLSIGGIGTREAIFIILLGKISISKESALLIAFFDSAILGNLMASLFLLLKLIFSKRVKN